MNNLVFLFVILLCGTHINSLNVERTNRIAGGSSAIETQFRYMISLQERSRLSMNTRGHICGGALFTLRHAVTSGSCVHVNTNGTYVLINATEYRVFAGAVVLTNDTSADRHRGIEKITVHPNYSPNIPHVNDIAVITVVREFPSHAVSTVALSVNDPGWSFCQASGWGSVDHTNTASPQLMHITKTIFDQTQCQRVYSADVFGYPRINIRNTMICAIDTKSTSCLGDSGNPLVCNSNLIGIMIATRNICRDEFNPIAEVYTRISSYRSWLETTAGASTFQPGMAILGLICIVQIVTSKVLQ